MNIKFRLSSFRTRIILTLVLVITSVSLASFYAYNTYLSKKIYANNEEDIRSILHVLRDQIIAVHDGRLIKPIIKTLESNEHVLQTYLMDPKGKVLYPPGTSFPGLDTAQLDRLNRFRDEISLKSNPYTTPASTRAYLRMDNRPSCYACHNTTIPVLGYLMIDFSLSQPKNTVTFSRNFGIFFTLLMVMLIIGFVAAMHYRFVRKSLFQFKSAISIINSGALDTRLEIPQSKELGELGKNFNEMVEHFQRAQNELQKYHQMEMRNSQKMATIGEMAARLAHEIRNPITGIANAIEIINEGNENGKNKPILEEIQRQANRVNKAIANLLKYSRSHEINFQEGDLNEIIKSVVFFLENQSSHKSMTFRMMLDPGIPLFEFDSEQIENVLMNLGLNAIQACGHNCTVIYRTIYSSSDRQVIITVTDNGPGIPEDKLEDIFTPFYTTRTEGTGLGLAIAREVVQMHKGLIRVENNPEGGCSFHITLPA